MPSSSRSTGSRAQGWRSGWIALLLCCPGMLLLSSCGKREKGTPEENSFEGGVERVFERGPLKVVLRLDNPSPTIADRITLQTELTSEESYEVTAPAFGEKLEQFGIVDFRATQPELVEEGKVRETRTYVLEPFLSGDYVIPPMTFRFQKRDGSEEESHELQTEELQVSVSSLLEEDAANLEIHEIAPPVDLPKPEVPRKWIGLAIGAAIVLSTLIVWLMGRRKLHAPPPAPRRPAHEIAFAELEQLVAANLPEQGEIKEFYQRISDILRHYIENRFGLHAPECTTEEFLTELGSGKELEVEHKPLLGRFLEHCDLVKFAEHQPGHNDIQNTFDSCKNFIVETKSSAPAGAS